MANISGKNGKVYKTNSASVILGIKEWSVTWNIDQFDTTEFAATGPTNHDYTMGLTDWSGSFSGNHTGAVPQHSLNPSDTEFVLQLYVNDTIYYSGSAKITGLTPAVNVTGEATLAYNFIGTSALSPN